MKKVITRHMNYFEAIIQLRPATDDVIEFVNKVIAERPSVFISKVRPINEGLDLYVSSQRYAQVVGKRLKKRFGGTVKITRTLFGVDKHNGKTLYRLTVLYRLPEKEEEDGEAEVSE